MVELSRVRSFSPKPSGVIRVQDSTLFEKTHLPRRCTYVENFDIKFIVCFSLADLHKKFSGARPPTGPNSFVFSHIFIKKHPRRRSRTPTNGSMPPTGNPESAPGFYTEFLCKSGAVIEENINASLCKKRNIKMEGA